MRASVAACYVVGIFLASGLGMFNFMSHSIADEYHDHAGSRSLLTGMAGTMSGFTPK